MANPFHKNSRTQFTRKCIAEAIIDLMQKQEFSKIRITSVILRAGVSRKTFYNYFDSTYSALTNYLQEIISEYLSESNAHPEAGTFLEYPHILYSLQFFDRYARFFITLDQQGMHSLMLDGINQFMIDHIASISNHSIYEMYCYAGGLLNTFLKWEENKKSESPESVARVIYQLYNS